MRSWLAVPLVASDEYLGFLSVGHSDPNLYTQEDLRRAENGWRNSAAAVTKTPVSLGVTGRGLRRRSSKNASEGLRCMKQLWPSRKVLVLPEEKFQKVFRSSPIAFSITAFDDGRFLDVNSAFEGRYGYSRAELVGHTVHELGIWEDPADRVFMTEQLNRGGPIRNVITRLRAKSGEIKLTAYSADRIEFEGQACILAVSEDVHAFEPNRSN